MNRRKIVFVILSIVVCLVVGCTTLLLKRKSPYSFSKKDVELIEFNLISGEGDCIITIYDNSPVFKDIVKLLYSELARTNIEINTKIYHGNSKVFFTLKSGEICSFPIFVGETEEGTESLIEIDNVNYHIKNKAFVKLCDILGIDHGDFFSILKFLVQGKAYFDFTNENTNGLRQNIDVEIHGNFQFPSLTVHGISGSFEDTINKTDIWIIGKYISLVDDSVILTKDLYGEYGKDMQRCFLIEIERFVQFSDGEFYTKEDNNEGELKVGDLVVLNGAVGEKGKVYSLGSSQIFMDENETYLFSIIDLYPKSVDKSIRYWLTTRSYGVLELEYEEIFPLFNDLTWKKVQIIN